MPPNAPPNVPTGIARLWRLGAVGVVAVLLLYGSVARTDDFFPFGPIAMFSYKVDGDVVKEYRVEGVTAEGGTVSVEPKVSGLGLSRDQLRGQLHLFVRDPSRLQAVADNRRRLSPDKSAFVRVAIVVRTTTYEGRRVADKKREVKVSWVVR